MTLVPDFYNEADGTKRLLAEYAKLKAKYNLTNPKFVKSIGYDNDNLISDMAGGRSKLAIPILVNTKLVYPEFNMDYVLFSKEVPEVSIPNSKWGEHGYIKHKERAPRRTREQIKFDRQKLLERMEEVDRNIKQYQKAIEKRATKVLRQKQGDNYVAAMEEIYTENRTTHEEYTKTRQQMEKELARLNRILKIA